MAWLSGYSARKELTISSEDTLSNYQKKVTLHAHSGSDTEGADPIIHVPGCQADFDDIRFTGSDGTTLLDYWIESISGEVATIWVEMSLAEGDTTVYLYWGNSSATAVSDGDATFPFFDDFSGTSLDTDKWTQVGGGTPTFSSGYMTVTANYTGPGKIIATAATTGDNTVFTARFKAPGGSWVGGWAGLSIKTGATGRGYNFVVVDYGGGNYGGRFLDDGVEWGPYTGDNWAKDTWYVFDIVHDGKNVKGRIDGGTWRSVAWSGRTGHPALNIGRRDEVTVWDYAFTRVYAATEPTVTIEAEEYQKAASETLKISLSEALDLLKPFSVSDSILVSLTEAAAIAGEVAAADSILLALLEGADVSLVGISITASDDILVKLTSEVANVSPVTLITAADSILIALGEDRLLSRAVTAADSILLALTEGRGITSAFTRTDSIKVKLTEEPDIGGELRKSASDSILVALTEGHSFGYEVIASDSIKVKLTEAFSFPGTLYLVDGDDILVSVLDSSQLDNPTTASDKSVRRLHGKVKISYTDPSLDEDSEITSSSGFARGSTEDSLFDGMIGAPVKYMMLDGSCPLDGTVSVGSDSIGWRGDDMSDETGAVNEWIAISFATPRTIHNLNLYGDNQWNNFPVAFSIYAYDEEDNEIEIDGVSPLVVDDNDEINWSYAPLTALSEVKKIKYEISKISQPLQPIMITELYSSYSEEYTDAEIISIRVLEEMEYSSGSIPLGNISSNECAIKLNNSSHKFDLGNPYSPVSSLMLKNRRVEVWFGIEVPFGGETIWTKRGVFWTQDWSVPEDQIYVEITALDRLELLRKTEYYSRTLHIDKSIGYLLEKVLDDADLVKDTDYWIHPDLYEIIIPYGFFKRTSHREAVRSLAVAAQAKAYCDGDGCIVVEPWDPGTVARVQFTRNKFKRKDNPLAFSEIVNFVEVYANPREIGEEEEIYTDSEVLRIEPGETATRTCVFEGDDPCTDVQEADFDQSAIIDLSDVIWINLSEETNLDISSADTRWMRRDDAIRVTLDEDVEKATGAFLVEPEGGTPPGAGVHINSQTNYNWGSEIEFHNTGNVPFEITSITIRGKPVRVKGRKLVTAQDSGSIRAYGKLSLSSPIDNEFIQSEELAQEIADDILAANKATRKDVTIEAFGYTDLELGDRIQAVSFQNTELKNYALTSQEFEYDRGVFRVKYKGRRI